MKYYILMERHFEYTDEYYYAVGGGNPKTVFTDKIAAEKELERRTIKDLTGVDRWGNSEFEGRMSFIDWEDIDDFKEALEKEFKNWEDKDFFDKLSLEDKRKVIELFKEKDASPFEIVEVESA